MIAIQRSQRAAKITLGGFGDLDIESFNLVNNFFYSNSLVYILGHEKCCKFLHVYGHHV